MGYVSYIAETLPLSGRGLRNWKQDSRSNKELATHSEDFIARLYLSQGWRVLTRNYQGRGFEIDILLQRQDLLVAVEVKARRYHYDPGSILSRSKINSLKRGMNFYMRRFNPNWARRLRIDLAICLYNSQSIDKIEIFTDI
jgi:putative endonuclease